MDEINCNIIKDILPSYVDGICSEDSRKLVGRHLQSCPDCMALEGMMREAEVLVRQKESKQVAYMKKIKRHTSRKELFGLCMMFVVAGIGLKMFADNYGILAKFYQVILPMLLIDAYFLLSDHVVRNERTREKMVLATLGGVMVCYSLFLALWIVQGIKDGSYLSWLEVSKTGPFFVYQCRFLIFCQLAIFAASIVRGLKTSNSYSLIIGISMTGIFLDFYIISVLGTLETTEHSVKAMGRLGYILLEGALITCIALLLEKKRIRKRQGL